ncbi:MAG: PKD domain-containing protein [Bacteroidota bacterium]
MKTKHYFFFFLLLLILGKTTKAEILGADLSYQCTPTLGVYKVNLKVYRSCQGVPLCNGCSQAIPNGTTAGCTTTNAGFGTPIIGADSSCLGTSFGNYTLAIQSGINGYDIIQTCDSVKTICTNCNTRTAGTFAPGIEVYIFEGNVNLNSLPTSCCKVALGLSICCRTEAITNFLPSNLYTECIINRCLTSCNNSPIFTNEAVPLVCAGVDYVYNLGAIDPDGDSLSYTFGASLQNPGSSVTYNPPYSAGYPFAYLGAPNASGPYPAGLRIDPITGDVMFRPSGAWVSNLVIEVTQWKKSGNTRVNVGITRRDIQFQTQLCNGNLTPRIKIYQDGILQNTQSFSVNVNQQICLDIVAADQANLSATPNPILADSTDLTWNNPLQYIPVMANATWARNYILSQRSTSGPLNDSFKFCWTPPTSAIRDQPYLFTVTGRDRFCPLNASAIRGISIKVNTPLFAKVSFDSTNRKVFCANKIIPVSMSYKVSGITLTAGNIFYAHLSDSLGNFNTPILVGSKISNANTGSINLNIPSELSTTGNYKLRLRVSSDSTAYDPYFPISIVPGFTQPIIFSNTDSICKGSNILLSVLPNDSNYTFKWLFNNTVIPAANNDSLWLDTTGAIRAIVSNTGCSDTSVVKTFHFYPLPIPSFTSGNLICLPNNPVSFINTSAINSGTMSYNWKFSDGTNSNLTSPIKNMVDTGSLTVKLIATSDKNCIDSIQKIIIVKQTVTPQFSINDSSQCVKNNAFVFTNQTNNQGASVNYIWNWGTGFIASNNITQNYSYPNVGNYIVKLISNNNGCTDTLTKNVTVIANATNVGFTVNKASQCLKNNNFLFNNSSTPDNITIKYMWQFGNGDTSTQRSPDYSYNTFNVYSVKLLVTANNKCIDSFSTNVAVIASPKASFTINDSAQCLKNNNFVFTNTSTPDNSTVKYYWQLGNGNNSIQRSPSITYSNSNTYPITLVVTVNDKCIDSISQNITVFPNPIIGSITGSITGSINVSNPGIAIPYSVPAQNNATYNWSIQNGTIQSGQNTNAISVMWTSKGTGKLGVLATNTNGCKDSASLNVNINNVGIHDININQELSIYPNPTKSSIRINNTNNNLVGKNYIISNTIGQMLLSGKLNAEETTVNLESLSAGIYLLSIEGISNQSIKVIKE